jgi:hypothetical protein
MYEKYHIEGEREGRGGGQEEEVKDKTFNLKEER